MIEYYKTFCKKEWRWRIKASNGRIIAASSECYRNKADAEKNLYSVYNTLKKYYTEEQGNIFIPTL